jgi:hypothetical protein
VKNKSNSSHERPKDDSKLPAQLKSNELFHSPQKSKERIMYPYLMKLEFLE